METLTEQPGAEVAENNSGGSDISTILTAGLKEKNANPEAGIQAGEGEANKQPDAAAEAEAQAKAEELFGELIVSDAQKFPFKTKDELEAFIEKNKDIFGKTSHFMRQSDYTRKTQELAKQRQEFEESKAKEDESWGEVKPDENSMAAFRGLWDVFQFGSPDLKGKINAFMQDVSLMASGKNPVGPLAQAETGKPVDSAETLALKRELAELRRDMNKGKTLAEQKAEAEGRQQAEKDWQSWKSQKETSEKVRITEEVEKAMVPYLLALRESDMDAASKCDRAYKLASADLGLDGKKAVKEVFASAEDAKKRSSLPPTSKASSAQEPEPKNLSGILQQGLQKIRN